jgi:T5orf172 domain
MNLELTEELKSILRGNDLLLGKTFSLIQEGVSSPTEIAKRGGGANPGAASNNKKVVMTILEGLIPESPSVAKQSASAISSLLKQNPEISTATKEYLEKLKNALILKSSDPAALAKDNEELIEGSEKLSKEFENIDRAIYVYSFPTYLMAGLPSDPEITWLKIGSTSKGVWKRIVEQTRQTSMPEDPVLLRIYFKSDMDVNAVESKFHEVLTNVRHERASAKFTKSGTEWFATTLVALDTIAQLLNLEIKEYSTF